MTKPGSIRVAKSVAEQMLQHAQAKPHEECCGLLAGRDGAITRALCAVNVAQRPSVSYEIAPEELFRLMREIRAAGLGMLGIYHSHPDGENLPSPRDLERAFYPEAAYFIVSPRADASQPLRAFSIRDARATEVTIELV